MALAHSRFGIFVTYLILIKVTCPSITPEGSLERSPNTLPRVYPLKFDCCCPISIPSSRKTYRSHYFGKSIRKILRYTLRIQALPFIFCTYSFIKKADFRASSQHATPLSNSCSGVKNPKIIEMLQIKSQICSCDIIISNENGNPLKLNDVCFGDSHCQTKRQTLKYRQFSKIGRL